MKRILIIAVSFLVLISLFPSLVSAGRGIRMKENRLALVIGNGAYKRGSLKNPVNDARDMTVTLKNLGFEVIHRENGDRRAMMEAIIAFGKKLRQGGVGLFYFAGHGIQLNGRNYLIPINAYMESESDVQFEAVDAGRVLGKMEDADNNLNIVILDACRDNPFARGFRLDNLGLAKMDAPKGSLIAYATAPGSVAADGAGRNGIYTKYLMEHMNTPGLKIEEALKRVRVDVMKETGDKQIPWESSSLIGDFYFLKKQAVAAEKQAVAAKQQRPETNKAAPAAGTGSKRSEAALSQENIFWESIKNSDDPAFFEAYLKKFPKGTFAELAALKIEQLKAKQKTETAALAPAPKAKPEVQAQTKPETASRDDRFVALSNGILKDTKAGLEWIQGPGNLLWDDASEWIDDLTIDGGGWRMPSLAELKTLYEEGVRPKKINLLFKGKKAKYWSSDPSPPWSMWVLDMANGGLMACSHLRGTGGECKWNSVMAVRSHEKGPGTSEKPKEKMASLSKQEPAKPPSPAKEEASREGPYIQYTNGIVFDTKTNLEWLAGPDEDTDWYDARSWVKNLEVDGGGWRMPTLEELKTLYQRGKGKHNITPLFQSRPAQVWTNRADSGGYVSVFSFVAGRYIFDAHIGRAVPARRAFAVRSKNE